MEANCHSQDGAGVTHIGTGPYSVLVLLEGDGDMWLASVRFGEPPQPGLTFHFRGMVWELTWASEAGCGAAPAAM
jgi:hypothetical protein